MDWETWGWALELSFYLLLVLAACARLAWVFLRKDLHRRTKRPPRRELPVLCSDLPRFFPFLGWVKLAALGALLLTVVLVKPRILGLHVLIVALSLAGAITLLVIALRSYQVCCAWHHLRASLDMRKLHRDKISLQESYCLRGSIDGFELKVWCEPGNTEQSAQQLWGVVRIRTWLRWPEELSLRLLPPEAGRPGSDLPDTTGDAAFDGCFAARGSDAPALLTSAVRNALLQLETHSELECFELGRLRTWLTGRGRDASRVYGAVLAQVDAHKQLAAAGEALLAERMSHS